MDVHKFLSPEMTLTLYDDPTPPQDIELGFFHLLKLKITYSQLFMRMVT